MDSVEDLFGRHAAHLTFFGSFFFSSGGAARQALVATCGTNGRAAAAAWRSATAAK